MSHHLAAHANYDKDTLLRYVGDGLAGMRAGMHAYDSAISHVTDENVRERLGEFKADDARLYELGRVAARSLGGDANRAWEGLAAVGARVVGTIAGARRDAYSEARELKGLVAGEMMTRFDFEETLRVAERVENEPLRRWAREGAETAARHLEYLEGAARAALERAVFAPRRPPAPPGDRAARDASRGEPTV